MAKNRVELHYKGFDELRKSPGVVGMLRRKAEAVSRAAGPGHDVQIHMGATRARATIMTKTREAKENEARTRALLKALGAARG